uniref:Secreted protein n=1 Tax=Romanomermis culicivorax TaxID=13658 RepID=A0A915JCA5_ROMCU
MVGPRVVLLAATISVAINSTRWKNRADAAGQPDDWSRYAIVGIFFEYRQFLVTAERVNIVDTPSSCQSSPRLVRLQQTRQVVKSMGLIQEKREMCGCRMNGFKRSLERFCGRPGALSESMVTTFSAMQDASVIKKESIKSG